MQQSLRAKFNKRKRVYKDDRRYADSPSIRRRTSDGSMFSAISSIHACCDKMHVLAPGDIEADRNMYLRMKRDDRAAFLVRELSRTTDFSCTSGHRKQRHPVRHNVSLCRSCFQHYYAVSNGTYYKYYNKIHKDASLRHIQRDAARKSPKVCVF